MAKAKATAARLFYAKRVQSETLCRGSKMKDRLVGRKKLTPIPGFGRLRYPTVDLASISGVNVRSLNKGGKDE